MELNFTSVGLALVLLFIISKAYSFARNYAAAVRTGYPVFASPILSKSIPWMILGTAFLPHFKKWLPKWVYERMDVVTHGWEFRLRTDLHDRLGKIFVVPTPDEVSMW